MAVVSRPEAGSSAHGVVWVSAETDFRLSEKHGSAVKCFPPEWFVALTRGVPAPGSVTPSGPMPPYRCKSGPAPVNPWGGARTARRRVRFGRAHGRRESLEDAEFRLGDAGRTRQRKVAGYRSGRLGGSAVRWRSLCRESLSPQHTVGIVELSRSVGHGQRSITCEPLELTVVKVKTSAARSVWAVIPAAYCCVVSFVWPA